MQNEISNRFLGEELTEFDFELLRGLQIEPPVRLRNRFLKKVPLAKSPAEIGEAGRLATPLAWTGLAILSSGAIVFCFWLNFLIRNLGL